MKFKTSLTIFLTIFLLSNNVIAKDNGDKWAKFKRGNYSIKYPANWRLLENGNQHGEFYILVPVLHDSKGLKNTIYLKIEPLNKNNNSLEAFAKSNKKKINHYVTQSTIISNETLGKKKKIYQRIEYTAPYPESVDARWVQYYFVKNDYGYMITAQMEDGEKDKLLPIMEEVLKTFKINGKKPSLNGF